jgi:hypothetical protein
MSNGTLGPMGELTQPPGGKRATCQVQVYARSWKRPGHTVLTQTSSTDCWQGPARSRTHAKETTSI